MNIRNILLPVDDSVHSEHAAEAAVSLASQNGATVTLLTCYDKIPVIEEVPVKHLNEYRKQVATRAGKVLAHYRASMEKAGISFKEKLLEGAAGTVIEDLAKSGAFDLVVMGSGGHSSLAGLFVGSVTHKVISALHCPVMIVP